MRRLATLLTALFMVAIAGSAAVVLNRQLGFSPAEAAVFGGLLLIALVFVNLTLQRRGDRRWLEARIAEVAAVTADVTAEAAELRGRLRALDGDLPARLRREAEPLAAELETLGDLVKTLADTVVGLDARLEAQAKAPSPTGALHALAAVLARSEAAREATPAAPVARPPAPPPEDPDDRDVEAAIRGDAVEIHLQPIVTMPQRRVRYYEATARLKRPGGELIPADRHAAVAARKRLSPRLDTITVVRGVQVLKRLAERSRDVGLFVSLAGESFGDAAFFRELHSFLGQNAGLSDLVVLELPIALLADPGPLELEALAALSALGFRFAAGGVADLGLNFHALARRGVRFAKVPVSVLLDAPSGDIHAADIGGHLARQGVELIVDGLETEAEVVELLEHDIRLAQGNLFSVPRPVRAEVLVQKAAARPDESRLARRG